MISPYQLLRESGFAQYTAMIRIHYNRENTSLGAEKIAEMVRAIPGATRVSTVSLDKEHGIAIFNAKIISQKPPKEAYQALKQNALDRYRGLITGLEIGANTIETKGDFIIRESDTHLGRLNRYLTDILLEEGLLLEVSIEELRKTFVETGKLSAEVFNRIVSACNNQSNFVTWLCKKIADGICSEDAIDVWGERFEFFTNYKQRFRTKDINQLKTKEQIQTWISDELQPAAREVFKKNISGGSQIQDEMIKRLEQLQVGTFKSKLTDREYYVFKLGKDDFDVEHYLGSGTTWCTRNNKSVFLNYLLGRSDVSGTDSVYWIFVNKDNTQEKWQLLFKANYFCDRKDTNFLYRKAIVPVEMYKYLKEKFNQQFDSRVQQHINWLEQTILGSKDNSSSSEDGHEQLNPEQYFVGTESSFKAYEFHRCNPAQIPTLLTKIGLCKNPTVGKVIIDDELDTIPDAVIFNAGSKKAEPLYISVRSNVLCQSDDKSFRFENLRNENEYSLLKQIAQNIGARIDDRVEVAWNPNLPGLKEFRYEDRNDVWKFEPADVSRISKANVQLANLATSVATEPLTYDIDNMLLHYLQGSRGSIYAMHVGHFVGLIIPPENESNRTVDTEIALVTYGERTRSVLLSFKAKIDRVGIPVHFEDANRSDARRSNLFLACYAQNFSTLESLDAFKVTSNNPDANEKWDIYSFRPMQANAIFSLTDRPGTVALKYKGGEDNQIVIFEGSFGYTYFAQPGPTGWDLTNSRSASSVFNLLGIRTRGDNASNELSLLDQTLQEFSVNLHRNSRYSRYLPNSSTTPRTGVPSYLRAHWDELQHIEEDWSRRGRIITDHGIKLPWDQVQEILRASSPNAVSQIEQAISTEGLNLLDVLLYVNTNTMSDWNCVVRFVDSNNQVVKIISRTGAGAGLVWRQVPVSERNRITVDENGNTVQTAPAARQPARQPARPRAVAEPTQQEVPATNVNLQAVHEYVIPTECAQQAYRADSAHAATLLQAFGFTNLANSVGEDTGRNVLVYEIYPHRGGAQYAALIWGRGANTFVASMPLNPTVLVAQAHSVQWRQLTRELDNSVRTFQQCHDICQEQHIPLPAAIQAWLLYRGVRQNNA